MVRSGLVCRVYRTDVRPKLLTLTTFQNTVTLETAEGTPGEYEVTEKQTSQEETWPGVLGVVHDTAHAEISPAQS